ncbi:MAG: NAD(P)-dependent oxidoreductase [Verrucomicrobia bacterium]|nr:NAD(P)-dependent oxidoreductase [Verrucomicrobiota bacterium]
MRIIVTGGSGFLGSACVRAATAAGHSVAVLTRFPRQGSAAEQLLGSVEQPPWTAIRNFAPDACVHAAWIATPGLYLESPENADWVRWSLAFLNELPALGVRHITVLGTGIEYQITGQRLREDTTPLQPLSGYARSKCELHVQLAAWRQDARLADLGLAWARIFYPYGAGEHPARLASSLIAKLRRGEPVQLKTPHSTKDYIHVDDVATALLTVLERRYCGAINVGTGVGVTVDTVAQKLGHLLGRADLVQPPTNAPANSLDYVVADAGRLHALGWRPQVALEAGLRRLVEVSWK